MKQRITSIAVAGIATVVIAGAGIMAGVNDNAVHADEPAKAIIVAGAGGSPDLPYLTYDEPKYAPRTALVGGSPDLPYLTFDEAKYRPIVGDNFGGGSPDLPNLTFDEPISDVLAYAGGSPDLPATF